MKICFISMMPANRWGGSEELWAAAARYALQQKQQALISAPAAQSAVHPEFEALKKQGAQFYLRELRDNNTTFQKGIFKIKRRLKNIPAIPAYYYQLAKAVTDFNPDLICVSQGGSFDVVEYPEVVWLLKNSGKPFFLICQSNLEHRVYPYAYLQRIREIYKAARKIYFIAQRNLEGAKRQLAMPEFTNYALAKNPCRLTERVVIEFPDFQQIHFAMVGRLQCRNKGQDILFQTLSAEYWKTKNWMLNIYGEGEDLHYLRELAAYFSINSRVHFHGYENSVQKIWKHNHILLMPSIEEGTPLALIEAMACGRTAVVTDVGDNAVLIREGETGFVAEAPTPRSVHAALERAWNRQHEWHTLGLNAQSFVETYIDQHPGKHLLESMITLIG